MTKKDYIKLANVFNRHIVGVAVMNKQQQEVYYRLLSRLIMMLAEDNPKFNRDKFQEAIEGN